MARKAQSRHLKAAKAKYDAASTGRRMAGWNTPSSGPNVAIAGLQKIRDRSRDVQRNEPSGAAHVRVNTTNIIGTGITPRTRTKDKNRKEKITKLWNSWVAEADADQVLDFYGLQALLARSWFMSGEVFARIRPRRMADGLSVPVQVQVLESDMVPLLDTDSYTGLPIGNIIRQGIELDKLGRRVAYWFFKQHPGDKATAYDATLLSRVPAESVCHLYEVLRPGQLRGVPEMASIIPKLKNVADFDDAVLTRQQLANLFTLFVTKPGLSGAADVMTGLPYAGSLDNPISGLEPGSTMELLPGEDVKFSAPPDAGANYAEFMREQGLGVSSGTGTPYELLRGDVKDVSDRTLRIILNEFRRLCEVRQWHMFIPQFCVKARNAWADFAYIAGELTLDEVEDAKDVEWSPHAWAYIHPVQDVQSKRLEVEAGFRSRSSVVSERGYDPEVVDKERADDKQREDSLGLAPPAPQPADQNKEASDKKEKKDKEDQQNALYERVISLMESE